MITALTVYRPETYEALIRRRGTLIGLERTLRQLEGEYARDVAKVRHFERRYRPAIGERYVELERLRQRISRGWDAIGLAKGTGQAGSRDSPRRGADGTGPAARPGSEARRLFLELARRIHPDLAPDETERRRRHEIMAEATMAYRDSNERRLQWLLEHWLADGDAVLGVGLGPAWSRTNRQIAWVRYRIREMHYSIGQLHASPVAKIMDEHERGLAAGRNLVAEMRRRVQAELRQARAELERLRDAIADLAPELRSQAEAAIGP